MSRPRLGTLETVLIRPAKSEPASMVALCHGYGATGTDLLGMFEEILDRLPESTSPSAYLFPEAPIDLSDEGMIGSRAWWRLNMAKLMHMSETNSFDLIRDVIPDGIDDARQSLCECIEACQTKHAWTQVPMVLGGFSQGAMLAVDSALRGALPNVAGLIVMSGALICESAWRASAKQNPQTIPFVQSHGQIDPILPIETGRWLHSMLREIGGQGELLEFYGPHTIPPQAIENAANLIAKVSKQT